MTRATAPTALLAVLTLATLAACDDPVRPAPEAVLTERAETARGVYLHAPGDSVNITEQETYYAWLFEQFDVVPEQPLVFLKYRNRFHMEQVTGRQTNGWAELEGWRFHTIWPFDNHECVHALVSALYGVPPSLIGEGVAVAHQTLPSRGLFQARWSGTPLDSLAARFLRNGEVPPLTDMLRSRDFSRVGEARSYPIAGSFVKSLLERHGYEPLKTLLAAGRHEDEADRLRANFRAAYGEDIETAWSVWLTRIATIAQPAGTRSGAPNP